VFVADQGVNVDVPEWLRAHELKPHHDHAGDPEEDDIKPSHHQGRGVEVLKFRCPFRPAHRGERPKSAAEPRVQHVLVLGDIFAFALIAFRRVVLRHGEMSTILADPGRNAVSPPELARNTPVPDVLHPLKIGFFPLLGNPAYEAVLNGFDSALRQGFGADYSMAAVTAANRVGNLLFPDIKTSGLEVFQDFFPRLHHF